MTESAEPELEAVEQQCLPFMAAGYPLVDFHARLREGLTTDDFRRRAHRTGINYGLLLDVGPGTYAPDDVALLQFHKDCSGEGFFLGLKARGRGGFGPFTTRCLAKYDYLVADASTLRGKQGEQIFIADDPQPVVEDPQAFVDWLTDQTVSIIEHEPIDILSNPTLLPRNLMPDYAALWTPARVTRIIDAAIRHRVALEINTRTRLPSPELIRLARQAGAKFILGSDRFDRDFGSIDYGLAMIRQCQLTPGDFWLPNSNRTPRVRTGR